MTGTAAGKLTTDARRAPGDRLADDLGWGLAVVFRAYVKAADAVTDVDGDGGDPMILDQQDAETVGERAIGEVDGRDRDPGARNSTGQDWPNARCALCFPLGWAQES